ncbi:MAG TPA: nitroreductase [Dehalococcoidales bacterium]|nr:MAG: hypothetical protein A2Z05_02265 [Chloroflexi bacterium RBG_16_60_22]HJX13980.1 nitroreductase [Dehalococcoidales bacterium]
MDILDAIRERRACRAFKPDPIPNAVLKKVIEQALKAPSWANTQPWEFAVVTGKPLKAIQDGFMARGVKNPTPDIARPYEFPEPYINRISALNPGRPELTQEEREQRILVNFTHYGAPAVIYLLVGRDFFYQSKGINVWSIYDCGLACENLMLAAVNEGLATVVQAQAVTYPDIVRKATGIPESKLIAMGIAIGYPDWKAPRNERRSTRDSMDSVVTWYGFH